MLLRRIYELEQKIHLSLRTKFYRRITNEGSGKFVVLGRIKVYYPERLSVGDFTTINDSCVLNARGSLQIGRSVHLSPGVIINTGGLNYSSTKNERGHFSESVVIEDGVWIGSGAIINPGVTIGQDSVIGAGSVVTKDVPQGVVAVGVPTKVIKSIN